MHSFPTLTSLPDYVAKNLIFSLKELYVSQPSHTIYRYYYGCLA